MITVPFTIKSARKCTNSMQIEPNLRAIANHPDVRDLFMITIVYIGFVRQIQSSGSNITMRQGVIKEPYTRERMLPELFIKLTVGALFRIDSKVSVSTLN